MGVVHEIGKEGPVEACQVAQSDFLAQLQTCHSDHPLLAGDAPPAEHNGPRLDDGCNGSLEHS